MPNDPEPDALHQKVFVRLLSPVGTYPSYRVATPDHCLVASEELAWSAVRQWSEDEHFRRGEIARYWPEEIRFYAAMSMIEPHPRTYGRYWITTVGWTEELERVPGDEPLASEALQTRASDLARELADSSRPWRFGFGRAAQEYSLQDRYSPEGIVRIMACIPPSDPLLLRGLSKFLIAGELYHSYLEEAGLAAFISLEAALEYIRQWLDPDHASFDDVFYHIREVFPTGDPFAKELELAHDARTLIVHPSSRFGEFWTPPVHREECMEMLHYLVYLYRYILLEEVWEPAEYD